MTATTFKNDALATIDQYIKQQKDILNIQAISGMSESDILICIAHTASFSTADNLSWQDVIDRITERLYSGATYNVDTGSWSGKQ